MSQSVPKPKKRRKKPQRQVCILCGKQYMLGRNFIKCTRNPAFTNNKGYGQICIHCADKAYRKIVRQSDIYNGILYISQLYNIFYSEKVIGHLVTCCEDAIDVKRSYIARMQLRPYYDKRFRDFVKNEKVV